MKKVTMIAWAVLAITASPVLAQQPGTGETFTRMAGEAGGPPQWVRTAVAPAAFGFDRRATKTPVPPKQVVHEAVEPALSAWARAVPADSSAEVLVAFRDEVVLPSLPHLNPALPLEHASNQETLAKRRELIRDVVAKRQPVYDRRKGELRSLGIEVREVFWLTDSMVLRLPAGRLAALAARPDVLAVERTLSGTPAPTVSIGRTQMKTDWIFDTVVANPAIARPRIAIIDTGAPVDHVQFGNRSRIDVERDCVHTTSGDCRVTAPGWNPRDTCDHGTSTAAIITALDTQGNAYRGVTPFQIGTYKVYDFDANINACGFQRPSGVRALQGALADGFPVILVEVQDTRDDLSNISLAADNAFNMGAVVVATNGNTDNSPTVAAPASARRVLGIGAYDHAAPPQTLWDQSVGPTADNRIKPDIQAPSNTTTAGATGFTALRIFGGTSGAGPYAAGAAALYGWLLNPGGTSGYTTQPGHVYATLIDSGMQRNFNNTAGAGRIVLPSQVPVSLHWYGSVTLSHQQYVDIQLPIQFYNYSTLSAAIWWPDVANQHRDIDLTLFGQNTQDGSWTVNSVFEKVSLGPVYVNQVPTIRIWAYSVPSGTQTVHWSAHTTY